MKGIARLVALGVLGMLYTYCSNSSPQCTAAQSVCANVCTDVTSDPQNCGSCGVSCQSGQVCSVGSCASQCQGGTVSCGGACVNVSTDSSNCGACGKVCAAGEACVAGSCGCTGSQQLCGTTCVDTAKDTGNCGACGKTCGAAQGCQAGACTCPGTMAVCGSACADLLQDPKNCGACGKTCAAQEQCAMSTCSLRPFGTGSDGAQSVATGTVLVNTVRAQVSGSAGSATALLAKPDGFQAGQTLLLHQTQGGSAGVWELAVITNVAADGTVTLAEPLLNTYVTMSNANAQAVVVPQYTDVDVATGAMLTSPAWDGATGGLLAFMATGTVSVEGAVTMDGQGFRGFSHALTCVSRACDANPINGFSGESAMGPAVAATIANGHGVPNGAGGAGGLFGQDCSGGGGGAYDTGASAGGDGNGGVCLADPVHGGGLAGGVAGDPDLTKALLFGGAGGEGGPDEDGAYPGAGGNGGGSILIFTPTITLTGTLSANGTHGNDGVINSGTCGGSGCGMGGGGGGAGGSIRLLSTSATLGTGLVSAGGAGGGSCSCAGFNPAGMGSNGRIQVRATTASGTSTPPFQP